MAINDGGPAFPCAATIVNHRDVPAKRGMSLRDYFAAQALARYSPDYTGKVGESYDYIAQCCYAIADQMLLHAEKGGA